jgi:hypothetical protein
VVVLGVGAALGAGLDTGLGAALEGPSLFEAPMSTFLHVPPASRFGLRDGPILPPTLLSLATVHIMAERFDIDAMIARFQERARAVKDRPLPPLEGTARREYMQRAQVDFQDFAMLGDAEGSLEDGILVLKVDLRPPEAQGGA